MDFDDLDEQAAGLLAEPAGEVEPLAPVPGFKAPPLGTGGCGKNGKLKLLCLHGTHANSELMKMQMSKQFMDKSVHDLVECIYCEAPFDSPPPADEAEAKYRNGACPPMLGAHKTWFTKSGMEPCLRWDGFERAVEVAVGLVKKHGPVDGLVGFSMGGETLVQLARLCEEGHPDLQGQFRFLLLMSSRLPKPYLHPEFRPKHTLTTPLFHTCCKNDDVVPPEDFYELTLHFDPECREVVFHNQGHVVPRYEGSELARLRVFFQAFHKGEYWRPLPARSDDPLCGIQLPLGRQAPARVNRPSTMSPIRIVCFGDPLNFPQFDGGQRLRDAVQSSPIAGAALIETPDISTPRDAEGPKIECPRHLKYQVVSRLVDHGLRQAVEALLKDETPSGDDPVVLVGVGLGAVAALRYASALCTRGGLAWRLYAIMPPVIFQNLDKGCLKACGITLYTFMGDFSGAYWRYMMTSHGPYDLKTFDVGKVSEPFEMLVADLLAAFEPEGAAGD
mmetsp:Transcript_117861/g.334189  ORF Transcript_117861/g.334189 Transcript_117861/m.334189 type:complete len:503 (+) Transcript_117861:50-1558(+)